MQNLFINDDDEVIVKFSVAEDKDGTIFCHVDKEVLINSLEEECEVKGYEAVFKKPSFGDTMALYDSTLSVNSNADINFNPFTARYNKVIALIKRWNLTESEEKPTEEDVKKLHPTIANTIGLQLEALIGDGL